MTATDLELYQQTAQRFDEKQLNELEKPLDPRLIKSRREGNTTLRYIEGHTAIDQGNRIFEHGNWGWHVLECAPYVVVDPLSGEGIGVVYRAKVEVWVRGMQGTIIDVGAQPVAVASVEEQIISRRISDANKAKREVDESPFTFLEKKNARAVIAKAHEQAEKGAATDALKRALRGLGNQFANELYGGGHIDISDEGTTVEAGNGPAPKPQTQPKQLPPQKQEAAQDPTIKTTNPGLYRAATVARQRATDAGLIRSPQDWQELLDRLNIPEFQSGKDIATLNRGIDAAIKELMEQAQPATVA